MAPPVAVVRVALRATIPFTILDQDGDIIEAALVR